MTIARPSPENLDWEYIETHLAPLLELKETPDLLMRLRGLKSEIERTSGG